jgi:hypothetical protein
MGQHATPDVVVAEDFLLGPFKHDPPIFQQVNPVRQPRSLINIMQDMKLIIEGIYFICFKRD